MADTSIQIADVFVVGTIAVSALWALARGAVREILGVGSWLLALFCALYGYEKLLGMFSGIGNDMMRYIISFGVVFVGVLTTSLIITERIADRVDDGALNSLDQILGFIFGILRGGVIVCLLYIIIASFSGDKEELPSFVRSARTLPMVDSGAQVLVGLLPNKIERKAERTVNLDDELPPEETNEEEGEEKEERRDKSSLQQNLDRIRGKRDEPAKSPSAAPKDKESLDNLLDSIQ